MRRAIYLFSVLVVVSVGYLYLASSYSSPTSSKPNIIFLMLDTLRADHLGVYGYERDTSPVLDKFAAENLFFEYAVSAAPWTPPSVSTMFTGLYPTQHGMMPPNSREAAKRNFAKLDPRWDTLAEILKSNGYRTGAVSPNPWITNEFGFEQGFDDFVYVARARADRINKEGFKLLDALTGKGTTASQQSPFFLYLHYLDPHDPFTPPPPFDSMYTGELQASPFGKYEPRTQNKINLYNGEIRYLDTKLGELFDDLKRRGLYDDAVIIIVGDHGEQFMERGNQGHGFRLHNEEIHVPLMIKSNQPARKVDFTVSTVDLFPTVLELAKVAVDYSGPGVSLLSDENSRNRSGVFSEIERRYKQLSFTSFDGARIIVDYELGATDENGAPIQIGVGVFDRHVDYAERTPIDDPELTKTLLKEFTRVKGELKGIDPATVEQAEVTDETIQQLKSLGYLQ